MLHSLVCFLLPFVGAYAQSNQSNASNVLTFALITSFGQFGLNTSGIVPAVDMAIEHINNRPDLLPKYTLAHDRVGDSQCQYDRSLDAFVQAIQSTPVKLAIIGCGCSVATQPVAAISHHWNISQISYSSESALLSDKSRYKRYFRTNPSILIEFPAFYSLMNHFGWKQIGILTQDESLFTTAEASIRDVLKIANYTVTSSTFTTNSDPWIYTRGLFSQDIRVFFLNCYSGPARKILCQALKLGYKHSHYAWIVQDWYADRWWEASANDDVVNCTDNELEIFLDRAISIRIHPSPNDSFNRTDLGILPQTFQTDYLMYAKKKGYNVSDAGGRAYDAVWVLAIALNRTMTMVKTANINGTGCENTTGSLVPLEQFQYSNEMMGCLIQWNIQRINISGVTGPIQFDANGTRIHTIVHINQYTYYGPRNLSRVNFAYLLVQDGYALKYLPGFNDTHIFPDGIPSDGLPIESIVTYSMQVVITIDILSAGGIVLALTCGLFNLIYRNKRIVRLSSARLNYLIVIGATFMYISVYLYVLPTTNILIVDIACVIKEWLFITGYALCFGTVLAKMWRVYYIFINPRSKKMQMSDQHMLLIVVIMVGIGVLLLTIGTGVSDLRGMAVKVVNAENPQGTAADGVQVKYYHLVCYPVSSPPFYWKILMLAYLAVFQIVGIVLAFETRKVKFPGLRDSAYVATIIYISSLVLVMLAVDTFVLGSYLNTYGAIFAIGILTLTTIFLVFTFVPKMVLLYQGLNPDNNSFSTEGMPPCDLEARIASLVESIQEKDKMIALLGSEIVALKVKAEENTSPCSRYEE